MKQVTQRLRDGRVEVLDVPPPTLTPDGVIVDIRASLLSAGTERSKIETGRQSLIGKARSRPDQVRQVVAKAQRDGFRETLDTVRSRLDQPSGIGYSAAGVVVAAGARVADLAPGDRVACGGGDHAVHAELDHVPGNLCVPLADAVSFEEGAFATVGSIALHGVRQADVRLGERVAVIGLGLVGQLACRLLAASGCSVVGVDLANDLVDLAARGGVETVAYHRSALDGELPRDARDCDAVIVAAATGSSDPVELAARLCRDRGRVVIIGDVGMALPRAPYYDKELDLRLSRSYGPGRYDREYEERGLDYPIGYVRWTERRNMAAFTQLVAEGRLAVADLITERIAVDDAPSAYEQLASSASSPLGIVLQYEPGPELAAPSPPAIGTPAPAATDLRVNVVGAGSFAQRILIPGLRRAGFELAKVASASGLSARTAAERFGFDEAVDPDVAAAGEGAGVVVVATRHETHAALAERALHAGRAVFVEKPPCLTEDELARLRHARAESGRPLVVGFNRRHAPLSLALRSHVAATHAPQEILIRVNAGRLPDDHWLNDPVEGGGRLLGEGCHFVDLACWLTGRLPERVSCVMRGEPGRPLQSAQSFTVALDFPDGSVATILYGAGGAPGLGKEYVEVHAGGRSAILDDFRRLTLHGSGRAERVRDRGGDKGHAAQLERLREQLRGEAPPPDPDHLDSMAVTLAALRSAEAGTATEPAR
jgi:predicted dehydrogenase/threonine dehydrogenase-like Zn-dependent dehydrogenase